MSQGNLPLVLAVDDERANLMLLERMFRHEYRIFCVQTVQEALDLLAQAPFDLILLDIMMPDVDGLTTLKQIRANPKTEDIPVILISALSNSADITRGFEIGANDYVTKPIDMEVTRARVRTQITLKKLLDERKQTITELRTAQEMKDRLLQMASHDLKGPLNNIRAASMLMGEDISCVREGETLLEAIETSADKMENVIKDFLDTAALQTGVLDLHLDCQVLQPLINNVLAEHRASSVRKNITLEASELSGEVLADRARFHQVLGNLISNAIKYSPRDTTVTLWTETKDDWVTIFVADQGSGIPVSDLNRLFTQFGKLTPRPTAGESSTGLGLWIVKHLITLQNGEVGLISPQKADRPSGSSCPLIRWKPSRGRTQTCFYAVKQNSRRRPSAAVLLMRLAYRVTPSVGDRPAHLPLALRQSGVGDRRGVKAAR